MSPEAVILRNIKSKYFSIDDKLKGIVKKDLHYVALLCQVLQKKRKYECVARTPALAMWIFYYFFARGGWEVADIQTKSSFNSQFDFTFKNNQGKEANSSIV